MREFNYTELKDTRSGFGDGLAELGRKNKNVVAQTLLNQIDVIIHNQDINNINLFVRKSFSEHLWLWINDSSSFL